MCFDLEPAEFFVSEMRRARKPHRCSERGCAINPGDKYEHVRAKWDGDPTTVRVCPACLRIKAEIERREIAAGCSASEAHPGYGKGWLAEVLSEYSEDDRDSILKAAEAEAES